MTTYTVTTSQNWDALSAPSGGAHTVNINGGTLTIDTDTRYNAVFTAATGTLGNVTISSTLGGSFVIDGTKVRLIPYNSGVSGNVPAIGTTISQGGVSATLLGVWSALNAAPTATGAAMPSSGFIKVKNKTGGNFAAGALTGIGASASAADVAGWIEVIGTESTTLTVPRLGTFTCTGDWFYPIDTAGSAITTSGSANQTIQLPASLANTYYPGVWIETGNGTGAYEFYPSLATVTTSSAATDVRGKVVWISSQGLCRIGNDGTNTVGYVPSSGCRIRVPNISLLNATSATPSANVIPNSTLNTRYRPVTTSGGIVNVSNISSAWYLSISAATNVTISNSATFSQLSVTGTLNTTTLNNIGVGLFDTSSIAACVNLANFSNGTISDITTAMVDSSSNYHFVASFCGNISFTNCKGIFVTARAGTARYVFSFTGSTNNVTLTNCTAIGGQFRFSSNTYISLINSNYADSISGTTGTSNALSAILAANIDSFTIDGMTFLGLSNIHSYSYLIDLSACKNVLIKNIGSFISPLSIGSVNISAGFLSFSTVCSDIKVKRVYLSGVSRTRLINGLNTVNSVTFENLFSDTTAALTSGAAVAVSRNIIKGCYGNSTPSTSFTNVVDTIFWDAFNSSTVGLIGLYMNEATSNGYASYVSLTSTAKFTGTGALYCPTSGDTATWTWPHYILGYTSLANVAPTITGGTGISGRITVEYQLDKNDGTGFGSWKALNATNLSGETGIDPSQGFKPKIRVTVNSTDTTNNTITGIYFQGTTDSTSQQTTYPLENSANLVCPNFVSGTRVYVARQQYYSTLTNAAINTSDDSITLGLSDAGFSPSLQTFAPRSLVRFNLLSGTIPTTSPQIIDGGLYYLKTYNSSTGKITLSVTSGGTTIDFTTAPTCTFQLVTETELLNTTVSGGSGLTTALQLPTNATVRLKAIYWTNSGTCRASQMLDGLYSWNESTGLRVIDTVSGTAEGSADTIHNVLIDASSITMPDGGTITPVNDGSTITSLAYALEGVGKVQINANETDGQLEVQNLYLWGVYAASTAAGIRVISADTFYAENVFSFVVQNLEFDNISSTPLYLRGGIIKTADGSAFVTPNTTGSIIPNTDTVGTGVILNLGTSPTQQQIRDAMALSTSATINSGSIDQLVRAAKNAAEANL